MTAPSSSPAIDLEPYLAPTRFIESEHPAVRSFVREAIGEMPGPGAGAEARREIAVRLFDAVRDGVRYDPYTWHTRPEIYPASSTLESRRSFCVPKAILLAAAARAAGIPSRLGFADVRNHLATARLLRLMRTDFFVFHGYTELWLDGQWIKATPTFNRELCDKFGVAALDWDGRTDAVLHPFDREGRRHMEYVRDRGSYADLPLDELNAACRLAYPHYFDADGRVVGVPEPRGRFEREAERESPASA